MACMANVLPSKGRILKGHCYEHRVKNFPSSKAQLQQRKPTSSGLVFVKLQWQCNEAEKEVILL